MRISIRRSAINLLALGMCFLFSCSANVDDGAVFESQSALNSQKSMWNAEEAVGGIRTFPDFPGFSADDEIVVVYTDKRDDYDCEGALHSETKKTSVTRSVWDEDYGKLDGIAPTREGYAFLGWRFDMHDQYGIDAAAAYEDCLARAGMSEEDLLKKLGGKDGIDKESFNTRLFQPGDDISGYYENVLCALWSEKYSDSVTGECKLPYLISLQGVWAYSGKEMVVEYYEDFYDADDNVLNSKVFFRSTAHSGAKFYGDIISKIPQRAGYVFKGWKEDGSKDIIDSGSNQGKLFAKKYANDDKALNICRLHPVWDQDNSFYYKQFFYALASSTNGDGRQIGFTALPSGLSAFVSRAKTSNLYRFRLPESFAIALQDVSGSELIDLLNMNKGKKWGFNADDLTYVATFTSNVLDDFRYDDGSGVYKSGIVVSGVAVDYASGSMKNMTDSQNKISYDYPISYLDLPQAMLICNMFTAAYNELHNGEKLEFAYAYRLTDDVSDPSVLKSYSDAEFYLNELTDSTLSLPGATGFRLPRFYEYQIATSIVPYKPSNTSGLNSLNDSFPAFVKKAFDNPSLFNAPYCKQKSMSKTSASGYKNPLGMTHATGNVRKWLESRLGKSGYEIEVVWPGLGDVGDAIEVNGEASKSVKVQLRVPNILNKNQISENDNVTSWFSDLGEAEISAKISNVEYHESYAVVDFLLEYSKDNGRMGTIVSTMTIPKSKLNSSDDPGINEKGNYVMSKALTVKVVSLSCPADGASFSLPDELSSDVARLGYDVTGWFPALEKIGAQAELRGITSDRKTVTITFSMDNSADVEPVEVVSALRIPKACFASRLSDYVKSEVLMLKVLPSMTNYMVRSGSFISEDESECEVHKMFDGAVDMRRSSSPYNYAFYDLGMRIARTL